MECQERPPRLLHRAHLHAAAEAGADLVLEEVVARFGGQTITSIPSRFAAWQEGCTIGPEPIACIETARELERAAHARQRDYIRRAREAGRSWYEIGQALDLFWEAVVAKESIADMAYDYALRYDTSTTRQPYTWTCEAAGRREALSAWIALRINSAEAGVSSGYRPRPA